MSRFPELSHREIDRFLSAFSRPGTLRYHNNKWVGLRRDGKPFTVHNKHGSTRKFPPTLVERIAKEIGVSIEEFLNWYNR